MCHAARLSQALITLSSSAMNKGSLSSLIPPWGLLLPATTAWHVSDTGADVHLSTLGMPGLPTDTCPAWGPQGGMPGETFRSGAKRPMASQDWWNLRRGRAWGMDTSLWTWLGTALQPGCGSLAVGTKQQELSPGCPAQNSPCQAPAGS